MTLSTFFVLLALVIVAFGYITWANASNAKMASDEAYEEAKQTQVYLNELKLRVTSLEASVTRTIEVTSLETQELKRAYNDLAEFTRRMPEDFKDLIAQQDRQTDRRLTDIQREVYSHHKALLVIMRGIKTEPSNEDVADIDTFDGTPGGDHTDANDAAIHLDAQNDPSFFIPAPPKGDEGGPATF